MLLPLPELVLMIIGNIFWEGWFGASVRVMSLS